MINNQDMFGNTPLHIAIENGNKECCLYLLNKGADANIRNKNSAAAIHQCVITNQPEILDLLLSHESKIDIHLGGENGATALHYCADTDNIECCKVLIKYNSNLCKPCNNGFFPIHTAAQRSANKVLEFLIEHGNTKGCSRLKMLSFVDGDNNKPLHAAVQFGNIDAVKLCLENGASIDETMEIDNSTPVHVACSQGSIEILKLMADKQLDVFVQVVFMQDSMQMTPLHKAAMFDHVEIAKYLIEKGAYIDSLDKEKRSPMLLAASRNCVKMVCYLISEGASIKLRDNKLRNLLHLVINQEYKNYSQNNSNESNFSIGQYQSNTITSLEKVICELIKV